MSAAISFLNAHGFQVKMNGLRIVVSPASKLTPTIRSYIGLHRLELLAELAANDGIERRGFWVVLVNEKHFKMIGEPCTYSEAVAAAQWRWPGAKVLT